MIAIACSLAGMTGTGCSRFVPHIQTSAQLMSGANGGLLFVNRDPNLSFPLSPAWSIYRKDGDDSNDMVHLHAEGGLCAIVVAEHLDFFGDEAEHVTGIAEVLKRDGHPIGPLDRVRVGTQDVPHIHSDFGGGVEEDLYGLRNGTMGLTLMTVRAGSCREDFGPILSGLRL